MVGDMSSPCPLPIGKVPGLDVVLPSHLLSLADANSDLWFAVPKGQLYGWLPLSNAYGISSVATQHKTKRLRHFIL